MRRKLMLFGFVSAGAIALSVATPSFAQDNGAQIEEVVVTARRVQENLQDVPVAVTAIGQTQLRQETVKTIRDLQSLAPSLYIATGAGGPSAANVAIRGQTQADTLLVTDPSVAVYLDGVNLPRQIGLRSSLFDIEQIEVLKGSQGTLFGKNTTGGALLFTTHGPSTTNLGGYVDITGGNLGYWQVTAAGNYPVVEDKLGIRLALQKTQRTGPGTNAVGTNLGSINDDSLRLSALFTPNDNIRLHVSADSTRSRGGGSIIKVTEVNPLGLNTGNLLTAVATELGLSPANSPANQLAAYNALLANIRSVGFYDSPNTYSQHAHVTVSGLLADLSVQFLGLTFRSITGQRWVDRDDFQDYSGTKFAIVRPENYQQDNSFSQEIQLLNAPSSRFAWIIGGYFSHEHGHEGSRTQSLAAISPSFNVQEWYVTNESLAAFGQANYKITDTIRVTGGVRYSKVKQDFDTLNRSERPLGLFLTCNIPTALRLGTACEAKLSTSSQRPSYLLSLDWKPVTDVMLYAKTASSFRGGGINPRGNASSVASYAPFGPEKTTDYEGGLKGDFLDRRLRINTAGYVTKYRGIQRSTLNFVNGALATRIDNAAMATVSGVESEITARPISPLLLYGSFSWTHARYDKFVDASGDRSKEKFPVPEYQYTLSATYDLPTPVGDLSLHTSYKWQDDVTFVGNALFPSTVTQKAYGLWDARASLKLRTFGSDSEIAVFAKNITNKTYFTNFLNFDTSLGYNIGFAGDPRTFGVEFRTTFGGG